MIDVSPTQQAMPTGRLATRQVLVSAVSAENAVGWHIRRQDTQITAVGLRPQWRRRGYQVFDWRHRSRSLLEVHGINRSNVLQLDGIHRISGRQRHHPLKHHIPLSRPIQFEGMTPVFATPTLPPMLTDRWAANSRPPTRCGSRRRQAGFTDSEYSDPYRNHRGLACGIVGPAIPSGGKEG